MREQLKLRLVAPPDVWLATWSLEEPVWAVVSGRSTATAMLAEVVTHAAAIPWRSDAPTRLAVGKAVVAIGNAVADARRNDSTVAIGGPLPLHRTEANTGVVCSTCDGGGCLDCTDPA